MNLKEVQIMDKRLDSFLTNSCSIVGAYIGLNTTLKNFLLLINNNSRLVSSFQKASKQSLAADLQSISGTSVILGDPNKLKEQKSEFINLIKSTIGINFTEPQKKFLFSIIKQFYEIQTVELFQINQSR